MRAEPVLVAGGEVPVGPPGRAAKVHVLLSDATCDSAILEFVDGELVVWHDRAYQMMTNEPTFDRQLAVLEYWRGFDPGEFLPGAICALDHLVRAHFHINAVVQSADPRIAAASMFSVIRQTSASSGISVADAPDLSTMRWRVVADHKARCGHVELVISRGVFRVDLDRFDFSEGAAPMTPVLGVDMEGVLSWQVSPAFAPAAPFAFQPAG